MYTYTQLDEADETNEKTSVSESISPPSPTSSPPPSRPSLPHLSIKLILATFLLLTLLILFYLTSQSYSPPPRTSLLLSPSSCSCGRTPLEALENGCIFDPFAAAWLPSHCRSDSLISQFSLLGTEQGHNWTFYDLDDRNVRLSTEEAAMRASVVGGQGGSGSVGKVATTMDWHHSHCVYLWLSLHYAATRDGVSVAPRYLKDGHVWHCARTLLALVAAYPFANDTGGISEVDVYP